MPTHITFLYYHLRTCFINYGFILGGGGTEYVKAIFIKGKIRQRKNKKDIYLFYKHIIYLINLEYGYYFIKNKIKKHLSLKFLEK
jgi:hypothetical protein